MSESQITINSILLMEGANDPRTGNGVSAPIGSLYSKEDGTAYFQKMGAGNTDWKIFIREDTIPYPKILANHDNEAHTGDTATTYLNGLLIPAGTIGVGDAFDIVCYFEKTALFNTGVARVGINDTDNITTITQLGLDTIPTSSTYDCFTRSGFVRSATETILMATGQNQPNEFGDNAGGFSTINIDWTQPWYLIAYGSVTNSGDTITIKSMQLRIYKKAS